MCKCQWHSKVIQLYMCVYIHINVCVYICVCVGICFLVSTLCLTLVTPWTIGSSVHGISQARILEWVAIYIYIFFFRFFSIIGYYKILLIVHCAIPKVFISFICNSVYLLIPNS